MSESDASTHSHATNTLNGHRHTWNYPGRNGPHELVIDLHQKKVVLDATAIRLVSHKYEFLELLVKNQGESCSKQMVYDHLYKAGNGPKEKIIDVFMSKLRKKLDVNAGTLIHTHWGLGYFIEQSNEMKANTDTQKVMPKQSHSLSNVTSTIGFDGDTLTLENLPKEGINRWVARRKSEVVAAIRGGLITLEDASLRYRLRK